MVADARYRSSSVQGMSFLLGFVCAAVCLWLVTMWQRRSTGGQQLLEYTREQEIVRLIEAGLPVLFGDANRIGDQRYQCTVVVNGVRSVGVASLDARVLVTMLSKGRIRVAPHKADPSRCFPVQLVDLEALTQDNLQKRIDAVQVQ